MKTCKGCKFAEWKKTAAGRLHPSGDGKCSMQIKVQALPAAMYWINGTPAPAGGWINRKRELNDHCPYWTPGFYRSGGIGFGYCKRNAPVFSHEGHRVAEWPLVNEKD